MIGPYAHRINVIKDVYEEYYKHGNKCIEIDVQPTKDGVLIVMHDDASSKNLSDIPKEVPTFEEFLRFIPDDVSINVEIKKYPDSQYIVDSVLDFCKLYKKNRNFYFSSFDVPTLKRLKENEECPWHLMDKIEKYDNSSTKICVHKSLLDVIPDPSVHESIFVYDVKISEQDDMKARYPFISGMIVDRM